MPSTTLQLHLMLYRIFTRKEFAIKHNLAENQKEPGGIKTRKELCLVNQQTQGNRPFGISVSRLSLPPRNRQLFDCPQNESPIRNKPYTKDEHPHMLLRLLRPTV